MRLFKFASWLFDALLILIPCIDNWCCICCQANPAGRESGHTGNMGELLNLRACLSE